MIDRRAFFKSTATAGAALALGGIATSASAMGATVVASGTFEGRSNHVTTGGVKIIEENGRYFVELADDFSLDNGPDPRVTFGKDGSYDPDSYLGALISNTGQQRYAVPRVWGVDQWNEIYIWCEVAGVPLGVAKY